MCCKHDILSFPISQHISTYYKCLLSVNRQSAVPSFVLITSLKKLWLNVNHEEWQDKRSRKIIWNRWNKSTTIWNWAKPSNKSWNGVRCHRRFWFPSERCRLRFANRFRTVSETKPSVARWERERAGRRECHTTAPAKTVVRFSSCTRRVARPSHPTLSCLLLTICHFDFVCPSLLNPHTASQLVVQLGSAPAPTHTSNKVMNSNFTKQYLELF